MNLEQEKQILIIDISEDRINNDSFEYYLNIVNDTCKSYFFGNYLIDKNTTISSIENIYLNNKNKKADLCCNSSRDDWKYRGSNIIKIDSCNTR
ncbi:hypothetical protein [Bernardetia sp.]|uniref:hypothetical protein n=1 Tax=Bernardetia sp. TaxID=1937974 RepID=UPI0025C3AE89|nr:hypothetical protein [Bernardetia sp.]